MIKLLLFLGLVAGTLATCSLTTPTTTYTTTDASVLSSIAYISNFKLNCNEKFKSLYAVDEDGNIIPLGLVNGQEWQISVVREIPSAPSGTLSYTIHSDEGLSLLKRKQASVPLATVTINHPGAYNGPWLNSEHLAAALGVVVGWAAISGKGKLLS